MIRGARDLAFNYDTVKCDNDLHINIEPSDFGHVLSYNQNEKSTDQS